MLSLYILYCVWGLSKSMQQEHSGLEHWVKWYGASVLPARNLSTSHGSGATLYLGLIHRDHQPTLLNIKSKVNTSMSSSCTAYFQAYALYTNLQHLPTHAYTHGKSILKIYSTFNVNYYTLIVSNDSRQAHNTTPYINSLSSMTPAVQQIFLVFPSYR
jgi:hypothetical protein